MQIDKLSKKDKIEKVEKVCPCERTKEGQSHNADPINENSTQVYTMSKHGDDHESRAYSHTPKPVGSADFNLSSHNKELDEQAVNDKIVCSQMCYAAYEQGDYAITCHNVTNLDCFAQAGPVQFQQASCA